jgi:hypothetical protein
MTSIMTITFTEQLPGDYGPYHDYPNEPIDGGNPYYRCCSCGASDPQINGTLSGHFLGCKWVQKKKRELSATK